MPSNALVESTITGLSPEIYWKMNQTSGTTIAQNGTATTGAISLSGTYTLADDELIIGDAARFIAFGTDGKGTASKGNFTIPTTTTTVSFLMKMKADFNDYALAPYIYTLGGLGDAAAVNVQTSLRFTAPNQRYISTLYETSTGDDVVNDYGVIYPGNFYSSNTVYHIAVTRGPDEILSSVLRERVYVNGVLRFTSIISGYPTGGGSVTTFYINTIWDDRPGFNISLGHFAIWDRVLSKSEVYSIAEAAGYNQDQSVDSTSDTYWGSYADIQSNLKPTISKNLLISTDPLINRDVLNPEEAYENVGF
jgi:hypothetical protein